MRTVRTALRSERRRLAILSRQTHAPSKHGACFILETMINNSLFTSKSNEWETPKEFFDQLNQEFNFTLDPCASIENHKCANYFTKCDDGLKQEWCGHTVFCNPPYGKELPLWVQKCYEQHNKYGITIVLLIPARTDTKYFHKYIYGKSEIRFIQGRLKFSNSKQSAPFPSMVVVYR